MVFCGCRQHPVRLAGNMTVSFPDSAFGYACLLSDFQERQGRLASGTGPDVCPHKLCLYHVPFGLVDASRPARRQCHLERPMERYGDDSQLCTGKFRGGAYSRKENNKIDNAI